jgi:hypothetical protein
MIDDFPGCGRKRVKFISVYRVKTNDVTGSKHVCNKNETVQRTEISTTGKIIKKSGMREK